VRQHARHQVVETERRARGDIVENFRFHAIDAHAHDMSEGRFFHEMDDLAVAVLDDAEIHADGPPRRRNRQDRGVSAMIRHEGGKVQIRQDIAVDHQERVVELLAQQAQSADRAERLPLLGILDVEVPLVAVAADAPDQIAEISRGDVDVAQPVAPQPLQEKLQNRLGTDGHQRLRQDHRIGPEARTPAPGLDHGLHLNLTSSASGSGSSAACADDAGRQRTIDKTHAQSEPPSMASGRQGSTWQSGFDQETALDTYGPYLAIWP
jgi:hypothetical protein